MGKIILTSNGLENNAIIKILEESNKKAIIIPTADREKENSYDSLATKKLLSKLNFDVNFFDVEYDNNIKKLLYYDMVYFAGGDPFRLMHFIKPFAVKKILSDILVDDKIIVGTSAGAMVLGTTIELPSLFSQVEEQFSEDGFEGIALVEINVCPHYKQSLSRFENLEQRICNFFTKM